MRQRTAAEGEGDEHDSGGWVGNGSYAVANEKVSARCEPAHDVLT